MDGDIYVDVDSAEEIARSYSKSRDPSRSFNRNTSNSHYSKYLYDSSAVNSSPRADRDVNGESLPLEEMLPRLAKRKSNQPLYVDTEQSHSPVSDMPSASRVPRKGSRSSLILEQSNGLGQFEALRTTDIQTDANSAASQAFNALKDNRPNVRADDKTKKIVDGREIRQEHELYGMTYGMMLGIRVLVSQLEYDRKTGITNLCP
jgi:hypothetical protein